MYAGLYPEYRCGPLVPFPSAGAEYWRGLRNGGARRPEPYRGDPWSGPAPPPQPVAAGALGLKVGWGVRLPHELASYRPLRLHPVAVTRRVSLGSRLPAVRLQRTVPLPSRR